MKNCCIFTTFYSYDKAYSLCNVVADQVKMFLQAGYKIKVLVTEGFAPEGVFADKDVTLCYMPSVQQSNEGVVTDKFEEDVKKVEESLLKTLEDVDVCLTHDVIFQNAHLVHNEAMRRVVGKLPKVWWLHWIHSCPQPKQNLQYPQSNRFTRPPNSFIVYPNSGDHQRVAEMYGMELTEVKTVPHPIDLFEFLGFSEVSIKIAEVYKLLEKDVVVVYPVRLDRDKKVEKILGILTEVKKLGRSVCLIICDFHSTGGDKVEYRKWLKEERDRFGLTEKEVGFTSEFLPTTNLRVPRGTVRDLMLISNLFILPSGSETYSLVAQEAAICGNLLLLNEDFSPIYTIYGKDALYAKFCSSLLTTTYSPNEQQYHYDLARKIVYYLDNERSIALKTYLRKDRNLDAVFKNYLEPLFYGDKK